MTNWRYHIKIKHLFEEAENPSGTQVQEIGKRVAEAIKKAPDYASDTMLQDIAWEFRNTCEIDEDFDAVLDGLYNWADEKRVWIE
jgi:transcriptional regulator